MSSLLSPIGPRPARVYWIRRLAVLAVPLIVIIAVAVSCSGGGGSPSAGSSGPSSSSPPSGNATVCAAGDLSAVLTTSETVYDTGQSPVFTGKLTNTSTAACKLTTSPSDEDWTVTSGADRFWTTAGCPRSDLASTKTLAAGASREVTITWDGRRLEPGCAPGDPAAPGTYHLHAKLDGVSAEQVTFHFTKNTD
jgi:hypothetical protein